LKRDLSGRIGDLRRIGGGEHEAAIDGINDSINDTFADLKDKLLSEKKETHQGTLETAAKFHKQFADTIAALERKIVGADTKIDRRFPEIPAKDTPRPDYPEKDIELPKGEVMDIVEGVRVARLMPLTKQQLGLDHGLSVNEIIDADKALARAGLEVYDIILTVNGTNCDLRTDLREALAKLERGTEYEIVIMRKGEKQTLKATK
jgi:S1-C subfamily serine protease